MEAWLLIYNHLLDEILAGDLLRKDLCPAIEEIADKYGVSRHTAARAYRSLAEDGYLRRYPGAGYVVIAQIRLHRLGGRRVETFGNRRQQRRLRLDAKPRGGPLLTPKKEDEGMRRKCG